MEEVFYFAEHDGYVGIGNSLENAHKELEVLYSSSCPIEDVEFYKGVAIKVELVYRELPVIKEVETVRSNKSTKSML